ncbi:MAG TPA: DEAD/DEAH box helicase [Candidatus Lokiarchaeia archaeon]|nr:DEAD/DEAH box helicase [Candidatus Lokiarchaeia archaeon]
MQVLSAASIRCKVVFEKVGQFHVRFSFLRGGANDRAVAQVINQVRARRFFQKSNAWTFSFGHFRGLFQLLKHWISRNDITFRKLTQAEIAAFFASHPSAEEARPADLTDQESYLAPEAGLFPFQVLGRNFLVSRGSAILADEMGLGKSIQAISAVEKLIALGSARKILIFCPASIKTQWKQEVIEAFTTTQCVVIEGNKDRRAKLWASDVTYYITNYENARTEDFALMQSLWTWDCIILDEATRVKNWKSKQAQRIRDLASPRWFLLTGMPIENNLEEFYQLLNFVAPWETGENPLGTPQQFRERFCEIDHWRGVKGYKNLSKFRELIRPFYLQRRKQDVWDQLPPVVEEWRWVDPDPRERQFYGALLHHLAARREEERHALGKYQGTLADFTRLRMAACHPTLLEGAEDLVDFLNNRTRMLSAFRQHPEIAKMRELGAIVREFIPHSKGVVFATNVGMVYLLQAYLQQEFGETCLVVTGEERAEARADILQQFREDPAKRVLLSTDALTYGVNLQCASYVVNYDLPLNPAKLAQRRGRIERIGQGATKLSLAHLVARDTIEQHVADILRAKRNLIDAVLESNDPTEVHQLETSIIAELEHTVFQQSYTPSHSKIPIAISPKIDFNSYFRQIIPEVYRTKTCLFPLEAINFTLIDHLSNNVSATISENGEETTIAINFSRKTLSHSCALFTPYFQEAKVFCPHFGALFRKLRKEDEPLSTRILSSLIEEKENWVFENGIDPAGME